MEEALRRSERRFRQVAENAREWIWEVDTDGLYTYASPVVEKILGYKVEEILGQRHFCDFLHPEDAERLVGEAMEIRKRQDVFTEFQLRAIGQGRQSRLAAAQRRADSRRERRTARLSRRRYRHHRAQERRGGSAAPRPRDRAVQPSGHGPGDSGSWNSSSGSTSWRRGGPDPAVSDAAGGRLAPAPGRRREGRTHRHPGGRRTTRRLHAGGSSRPGSNAATDGQLLRRGRRFLGDHRSGRQSVRAARWQRICTEFHRVNARTCARCIESDTILANQLNEGEQFSLYQCRNGLTDAASPDRHRRAGTWRTCSSASSSWNLPIEELFRRQAREFGFDEGAYLEAVCPGAGRAQGETAQSCSSI